MIWTQTQTADLDIPTEERNCFGARHIGKPCSQELDHCPASHWLWCSTYPKYLINVVCQNPKHYSYFYVCQDCYTVDQWGERHITSCRPCHNKFCVERHKQPPSYDMGCFQAIIIEVLC